MLEGVVSRDENLRHATFLQYALLESRRRQLFRMRFELIFMSCDANLPIRDVYDTLRDVSWPMRILRPDVGMLLWPLFLVFDPSFFLFFDQQTYKRRKISVTRHEDAPQSNRVDVARLLPDGCWIFPSSNILSETIYSIASSPSGTRSSLRERWLVPFNIC